MKLGFHDPVDYNVDIYFFAPPSLGLTQNNPKTEFINNIKSYVRLQITPHEEQKEIISAERALLEAQRLNDVLVDDLSSQSLIIHVVKNAAVIYEGYLKSRAKNHKNCRSSNNVDVLFDELTKTEKLNSVLRNILKLNLSSKRDTPLPVGCKSALARLGDYVSYLMVDYLAHFQQRIQKINTVHLVGLQKKLEQLAHVELELRKKIKLHVDPDAPREAKEEYLYRTGLLKKYFQRMLFIQVKSKPLAKRVFQPMAAVAAGLAAVWAGLFQQAQASNSLVHSFGLTPTWILTIGVIVYIVKDRIKEVVRHYLLGRVERVLPDYEKVLNYDVQGQESLELGRIRESVRTLDAQQLPHDIYDARYFGDASTLEAELGEDIVHYSKKILVNKKAAHITKSDWGLREVIRFSMSQYLQNMDDPFKEVSFIDDYGKLCRQEAHRVYYAHMVFQFSYRGKDGADYKDIKTTKLVLDKQGLVKVSPAVQNEVYV